MTTRQFTRGVTSAVAATQPERSDRFGRMLPGDVFSVASRIGRWRFMALVSNGAAQHVEAFGPLVGMPGNNSARPKAPGVRSFAPDDVQMPSQRAVNMQRRRRMADA